MRRVAVKRPAASADPIRFRSVGQALDAGTRAFAESRFHHDFSHVRVHADDAANASAASLQSRAFTTTNHIAFAAGEYAPHTRAGRELLLHELAHVVQQEAGAGAGIGQPGDAHERQASAVAHRVMNGMPARPLLDRPSSAAPQVQLQAAPEKDPKPAMLAAQFQELMQQKTAREKVNAPIAHAIAAAYVNRSDRPQRRTMVTSLHAISYAESRLPQPPEEPTEAEVYTAIVDALDVFTVPGNATKWKWRAGIDPNEGRRGTALSEIGKWTINKALPMGIEKLTDAAIGCVATWAGAGGLWAVVEIARGGKVKEKLEIAFSIVELIQTLKKPGKRPLYKYEQLLSDVMTWMAREQAKAAAQAAAEARAARKFIAVPDALRVAPH